MKKVLLTSAIFLILLVGLAFTVIYTGAYNVSAARPEGSLARWVTSAMMEHSVKRQAIQVVAPSLDDSALVGIGFGHYNEMCVSCHGSPAGGRTEAGQGLNPPAPDLSEAAKEWKPEELYWIIKNGIKMTGMPAFGPTHDEDELWGVVAFVRQLPGMSAKQYRAFSSQSGDNSGIEAQGVEKSEHHQSAGHSHH